MKNNNEVGTQVDELAMLLGEDVVSTPAPVKAPVAAPVAAPAPVAAAVETAPMSMEDVTLDTEFGMAFTPSMKYFATLRLLHPTSKEISGEDADTLGLRPGMFMDVLNRIPYPTKGQDYILIAAWEERSMWTEAEEGSNTGGRRMCWSLDKKHGARYNNGACKDCMYFNKAQGDACKPTLVLVFMNVDNHDDVKVYYATKSAHNALSGAVGRILNAAKSKRVNHMAVSVMTLCSAQKTNKRGAKYFVPELKQVRDTTPEEVEAALSKLKDVYDARKADFEEFKPIRDSLLAEERENGGARVDLGDESTFGQPSFTTKNEKAPF